MKHQVEEQITALVGKFFPFSLKQRISSHCASVDLMEKIKDKQYRKKELRRTFISSKNREFSSHSHCRSQVHKAAVRRTTQDPKRLGKAAWEVQGRGGRHRRVHALRAHERERGDRRRCKRSAQPAEQHRARNKPDKFLLSLKAVCFKAKKNC